MNAFGSPTHDLLHLSVCVAALALFALICLLRLRRAQVKDWEPSDVLVVYASQTGQAEDIARSTFERLKAGGVNAAVASLRDADVNRFSSANRILCVVSTTGEGDAPDEALTFEKRLMLRTIDLTGKPVAVLALGDRKYNAFCAFGMRLQDWLERCGAAPIGPCLMADDLDPEALKAWDVIVTELGAGAVSKRSEAPLWTLFTRTQLNPGSASPLFELSFVPHAKASWQAGDLVEVTTASGHKRDYSIASLDRDQRLQLFVREVRTRDGALGQGSRRLLQDLSPGDSLPLRLKSHKGFHAPSGNGPLLLIAAGSGLAGVKPHILLSKHRKTWVAYGERHPVLDQAVIAMLEGWANDTTINRLSLAFSRPDEGDGQYVQDVLKAEGSKLYDHLIHDGAVMVCGALAMGTAIERLLRDVMGDAWIDAALASGRYRRDLY